METKAAALITIIKVTVNNKFGFLLARIKYYFKVKKMNRP